MHLLKNYLNGIMQARRFALGAVGIAVLLARLMCGAQPFVVPNNGDLLAGFRKTGANQENYEAVVNVGNITNFEAMPSGSQMTIGRYSPSQLADSFSDNNNLQWSVSGSHKVFGSWNGFPLYTFWYTLPRSNPNSQTTVPGRFTSGEQSQVKGWVLGIGVGAAAISSSGISNADNTAYFVREPSGDIVNALSVYIGDPNLPGVGDFNGTLPFTVENTTPASFGSAVRSDLYQSCPSGTIDPTTHLTNGLAYYVGYFQFNPDGTMSFTRASTNSVVVPPPAPQIVSVSRVANVSTISFSTTNGATYTLYYTNAAGLGTPVTSWAASSTTVVGNGGTNSLSDTTTDAVRFYRIGAH